MKKRMDFTWVNISHSCVLTAYLSERMVYGVIIEDIWVLYFSNNTSDAPHPPF